MTLPEGMPEALGPLDKPEEVVWAGPADHTPQCWMSPTRRMVVTRYARSVAFSFVRT